MLVDLSERSSQPELMDDFKDGLSSLRIVFDDINRVNVILGGNSITVNAVALLIDEHPQEKYTIVDMGCGDGNMLREVAQYCRKRSIQVALIGVDLNTEVLQLAEEASIAYPEIEYKNKNILSLEVSDFNCDIIINTLCMHHFTNENLLLFLKKFNQLASIGVVINDLHRSKWAYYLFKLFSVIFIKTRTAKVDGLISISKGFVKSDLIKYSESLPEIQHEIKWKWAFRYVWTMKKQQLN